VINASNAVCGAGHPCRIAFAFDSGSLGPFGWARIEPQSPLPPIDGYQVLVDGRYRNSIPVEIRGTRAFGDGLVMRGYAVTVNGLSITGNWANGILVDGGIDYVISNCTIGTDPAGNVVPNGLRGITVASGSGTILLNEIDGNTRSGIFITSNLPQKIVANHITDNGASGIYIGPVTFPIAIDSNVISGNHDFAIGTDTNVVHVAVSPYNSMFDNGAPFDIGMDGPGVARPQQSAATPAPPKILSATYDAAHGDTIVMVDSGSKPLPGVAYVVYIYRNRGVDRAGRAEAEAEVTGAVVRTDGIAEAVVHLDLRGQLITAMTVRSATIDDPPEASSELSDGVVVQ